MQGAKILCNILRLLKKGIPPSLVAVLYLSLEDEGELIVFQPNNFKRIPAARGDLLKDKGWEREIFIETFR